MITRGRKYRIALGIVAGWVMAVLAPGVVAGLVVYQVSVRRIAPAVPTLVSGVRAEVTVVDAEVVHITPVMRATLMVASDAGGDGFGYGSDESNGTASAGASSADAMPLHEALTNGTNAASAPGVPFGAGSLYLPIQPTEGVGTPSPVATWGVSVTGLITESMTPLPLAIEKDEPEIEIEPPPTPPVMATETSAPVPASTPSLGATETLAPTLAPVNTWTPAPTIEPTPIPTPTPTDTVTVSPVPIVLPTETATTSPLESPLATPTAWPSATPVETETPTP